MIAAVVLLYLATPVRAVSLRGQATRRLEATREPTDSQIDASSRRQFCAACSFCQRYAQAATVSNDVCYLRNGTVPFPEMCKTNCRVCFSSHPDDVTVEAQGVVTSQTPLIDGSSDPVSVVQSFLANSTNITATVFLASYTTPAQSTDGNSLYKLTFLVQWRSSQTKSQESLQEILTLLRSTQFYSALQSSLPQVASFRASDTMVLPVENQGTPSLKKTPVTQLPGSHAALMRKPPQFPQSRVTGLSSAASPADGLALKLNSTQQPMSKNYGDVEELEMKGGFTDQCVGCERPMLRCEILNTYPWSSVGRLDYTGPDGTPRYCSAALIDNAIALTAAHCVYDPTLSNNSAWMQNAVFHMAFDGSRPDGNQALRGSYNVTGFLVLDDWYKTPMEINQGHDMALLILDRGKDGHYPGERSEPIRFCYDNCVPEGGVQQLDLLGYPQNYDAGFIMTRSSVVAYKTGTELDDLHFGTGVREGASGSPMIQNLGAAAMSSRPLSPNPGPAPTRNLITAVMSGGKKEINKGFGTPLSQYRGDYRFRALYDMTCARARRDSGVEAVCQGVNRAGLRLPSTMV